MPMPNNALPEQEQTRRAVGNGRYLPAHWLGEGRLGNVYQGLDTNFERQVAIKVIKPAVAALPEFSTRFTQSVRAVARVGQPGLIQVTDFGQQGDEAFIIMALQEGPNLAHLFTYLRSQKRWLTLREAVNLWLAVAQVVAAITAQGNQRLRALPTKIKFTPLAYGLPATTARVQPLVVDIGLDALLPTALFPQFIANSTALAYFAPEEVLGEAADGASDVYTLGVLAFELIGGRPLFVGQTIGEAVDYHANRSLPALNTLHDGLPAVLTALITKALAPDPRARYATPQAMLAALAALPPDALGETAPLAATNGGTTLAEAYTESKATYTVESAPAVVKGARRESNVPAAAPVAPPKPAPSSPPVDLPVATGALILQITGADGKAERFPMSKPAVTIGRTRDNDLCFEDDLRVSRKHARIEQDGAGYRVVDLHSGNGTYIDDKRVPPGGEMAWSPPAVVRVGNHTLQLQVDSAAPSPLPQPEPTPAPLQPVLIASLGVTVERNRLQLSADGVSATFFVPRSVVEVDPGSRASVSMILLNLQNKPISLAVMLKGPPAQWAMLEPTVYELSPGQQRQIQLDFAPPRTPQCRAALYALRVEVTNRQTPTQLATAELKIKVKPYGNFQATLTPEQAQVGDTLRLTIENQGNTDQSFKVMWLQDEANELLFTPALDEVKLQIGERKVVETVVTLPTPRWFGATKVHKIRAQISASVGAMQPCSGIVISRSRIPIG